MLRLRICPNCQEETYSQKAYFCHCCGTELPPPPSQPSPSPAFGEKGKLKIEKGKTARFEVRPKRLLVALAIIGLAAVVGGTGTYYFCFQNQTSLILQPRVSKNEVFVEDVNFGVSNHPFSAKGLSEIVPADVDLYLESVDPEVLLPLTIPPDDWSGIESVFLEGVGLSITEAMSFLEDEFAFLKESTASAFISRARDVDFLERKLAETQGQEEWKTKIVEGFLVVSNSSELIHAVEEAQRKLTLNLSLTPDFTEARKNLPKTGQIFYYGKKRLEFIPDEVKGEAFVIAKKDGGILITGLD